ncbi:MAG: n-acetylglutamate synthase [Flammeovirgaceae bacterium]
MKKINYHNKYFRSSSNTANGEVSAETTFHYRQEGERIIWATYEGGEIRFGTLSGEVFPNGELEFCYQHQNKAGQFMTGRCHSVPEVLADGRIRLHEQWQWTSGNQSKGESVIEEIASMS